jgi:hypothetical protein
MKSCQLPIRGEDHLWILLEPKKQGLDTVASNIRVPGPIEVQVLRPGTVRIPVGG